MSEELKPQHQKFVNDIDKGLPRVKAYQNAYPGSSYNTARSNGSKLLANTNIQEALRRLQQRTARHSDNLWTAQYQKAVGSMMVYRIDEEEVDGKIKRVHTLVTDPAEIKEVLDEGDGGACTVNNNYYFITDVPPDNKAIDSLLDRAFGKASQFIEVQQTTQNAETYYELFKKAELLGYDREQTLMLMSGEIVTDVEVIEIEAKEVEDNI